MKERQILDKSIKQRQEKEKGICPTDTFADATNFRNLCHKCFLFVWKIMLLLLLSVLFA